GRYEAWNRTGLSQGWPSGQTPYCSAISRSKRWTWGQSGVNDGNRSESSVVLPTCKRPRALSASTAYRSTLSVEGGASPKRAATRCPSATALTMVRRKSSKDIFGTSPRGIACPVRSLAKPLSLMASPPRKRRLHVEATQEEAEGKGPG